MTEQVTNFPSGQIDFILIIFFPFRLHRTPQFHRPIFPPSNLPLNLPFSPHSILGRNMN